MIIKKPEVVYNTIAQQIKRGVNSLTLVEWNFIINSLRVQANVNADQIKYIHSVLFGLDDVSIDGVALIPELYDKIYNGVIDRAAADGDGNNIINTYATKTELADLLELIVNETVINRAKHDQHGNVIDETYARVADVEDGTIVVDKALKDDLGNVIKDHYMASVIPTYDDNTNNLYLNPYNGNDSLMPTRVEGVTLPKATTSNDGLLSKEDKVKINNIATDIASMGATKQSLSEKNQINGYAGLDANAKIPSSLLPDSVLGQLEYKGTFTPTAYPSSPEKGWFYISIGNGVIGGVDFQVGDWAVFNGSTWDKVDNTDAVMSVNGKLGVVVLNGTDIKVGNGDTWTIEQRIVNIYAELNNRYTKAETYTQTEIEQRLTDLIGMANLQDILIGSYTDGQTVLASDLSAYNFVIVLGKDDNNTYTGTFKPSEIVSGNVVSLSPTVYLTRGATNFTITTPTSVKLWGIKLDGITADEISYDNSTSGLVADKVQDAIDELADEVVNTINEVLESKSYNCSNMLGITKDEIDISSFEKGKKCLLYIKGRNLYSLLGSQIGKSVSVVQQNRYFNFRQNGEVLATSGVSATGNINISIKKDHYYFCVIKFNNEVSSVNGGYLTAVVATAGKNVAHYTNGVYCVLKSKATSNQTGGAAIRLEFSSTPNLVAQAFCAIDATENGLDSFSPEEFFEKYGATIIGNIQGGLSYYTKCTISYNSQTLDTYDASKNGLSKYIYFEKENASTITLSIESGYDDIIYALGSSKINASFVGELIDTFEGQGTPAQNEVNYLPISSNELELSNKVDDKIGILLKKNNIKSATGIQNGNTVSLEQDHYLTISAANRDLYASVDRYGNGLKFDFLVGHKYLIVVKTDLLNELLVGSDTYISRTVASTDQYVDLTNSTKYFSNGYVAFTQKYNREYLQQRLCLKWGEIQTASVDGFGILDLTDIGIDDLTAEEVFELYGENRIQQLIEGGSPTTKVSVAITYEGGSPTTIGTYDSSLDGDEKVLLATLERPNQELIITTDSGYADVKFSNAPLLDGSYVFTYSSLSKRVYEDELRIKDLEANTIVTRNKDREHIVDAASVYGYSRGGYYRGKQFTMLIMTDIHNDKVREASVVEYSNAIKPIDAVISLGDVSPSRFNDSVDSADFYEANVAKSEKPFFTTIGNHDAGISADVATAGTKAQQFARWFTASNLEKAGLPSNYTKTYYYKDFIMKHIEKINNVETEVVHSKVRLFVLDSFDAPDDLVSGDDTKFKVARDTPCFSQAQIDWFIQELGNVPDDYTILVAMHWLPVSVQRVECNFTVKRNGAYNITGYPIVYPDLIPDIINAWKNKTTLTKTYAPQQHKGSWEWKGGSIQDCPTLSVNCDFSSRTASHFSCYIGGHMHADCVAKVATYPDQYTVLFTSSSCDYYRNAQNDLPRVVDDEKSITQDAITTITIDTDVKSFKFVRIGSNRTFDLEDRTCIQIKYEE